jgi:DNA-binding NarL/FixJ family response regulator
MSNRFEKSAAILIFDRQRLFREGLRNYLLASGYTHIRIAVSIQSVLSKLRQESFALILLGVSAPTFSVKRLVKVVRLRQPAAEVFLLVTAKDQSYIQDEPVQVLLKEYVYADLLELSDSDTPKFSS